MAIKQAFNNPNLPDFSKTFSWGLKVTEFKEVFFVTGHTDCDPNFVTRYPNDPVAQTKVVLAQMKTLVEQAGFTLDDVVRTDWTMVDTVTQEQFAEIAQLWQQYFTECSVKPATGTLRYVSRLGTPDIMVEYEMMLAR